MGVADDRAARREATLRLRAVHGATVPTVSDPATDGSFWAFSAAAPDLGLGYAHHYAAVGGKSSCGRHTAANRDLLDDVPWFVEDTDSTLICAGCRRKTATAAKATP